MRDWLKELNKNLKDIKEHKKNTKKCQKPS